MAAKKTARKTKSLKKAKKLEANKPLTVPCTVHNITGA